VAAGALAGALLGHFEVADFEAGARARLDRDIEVARDGVTVPARRSVAIV